MAKHKLCDIAPIIQGDVPQADQYWLLNLDMVESNTGRIIDYLYCSENDVGNSTVKFDTRNVLYSKLRPYLNKVVLPQKPGYATSEMLPLCPDQSIITREYLTYYLRSPSFVSFIKDKTSGAKMPRANSADLKSYILDCPSINEQQIVTHQLDSLVSIIEKRTLEVQKLDDLIKARFVEMFGDMVINPNDWSKYKLGEVCDVRDGTHDSPQYYIEGYPLVTSKNVTAGRIDLTDCNLICEEDYRKINQRSKVDLGDILMPMIGTVGNPVIVNVEPDFAIKNVALIKFKKESLVLNSFVKVVLESDYFDNAVISKIRGGTQKFISLGDIRNLEICLPPLNKQEQFEEFLEQVDKSKSVVQKSLDEAQLLFVSLMQQYFG